MKKLGETSYNSIKEIRTITSMYCYTNIPIGRKKKMK